MNNYDVKVDIGELVTNPDGVSKQLNEDNRINLVPNKDNKRLLILNLLELSEKESISVPDIQKSCDVSRQYIYGILNEFPTYKDKIKRQNRKTSNKSIVSKVLSYIDNEFEKGNKPPVKEISKNVGTTDNYIFTILNKHPYYKEKVSILKKVPRIATNEEIITFINESTEPLFIKDIAEHFDEKYNVVHGVITRNKELIKEENIKYRS